MSFKHSAFLKGNMGSIPAWSSWEIHYIYQHLIFSTKQVLTEALSPGNYVPRLPKLRMDDSLWRNLLEETKRKLLWQKKSLHH
eukprot:1156915-Pelagomonas_calceolata.AAC.8